MTNQELKSQIREMITLERKAAMGLLPLLREAELRRIYLEDGYSSLFDWLVKFHGYSSSAAYRRIAAARALKALPDAENKILSGAVNLTTLAQVQTTLQKEEKRSGKKIALETRTDLLLRIQGKSSEETQKILVQTFPESVQREESLRVISAEETKLTVVLDEQTLKVLKEAKDLLSHALPQATWAEVIGVLAENFVSRKKQVPRGRGMGSQKSERNSPDKRILEVKMDDRGQAPHVKREISNQVLQSADKLAIANLSLQVTGKPTTANPVSQITNKPTAASLATQRECKPAATSPASQLANKPATAAAVSLGAKRKLVFHRAKYRCEFVDRKTHKRCESTFQLELDHVKPRAIGGTDELENLRCLCKQHNLWAAERNLGKAKMRKFRIC